MVGNVVGQGIGNLTGQQKGFSWTSVAISGIGAASGALATDQLKLTTNYGMTALGTNLGTDFGRAATSAGAFALTQLFVRGGKVNWQQVATDTISGFIQNRGQANALINAQRQVQGNTTAIESNANSSNVSSGIKLGISPTTGIALTDAQRAQVSGQWNDEIVAGALSIQQNASNGSTIPLLFANSAAAGGGAGLSLAAQRARSGGLVVDYAQAADVGIYAQQQGNAARAAAGMKQSVLANSTSKDGWGLYNDMQASNARWQDRLMARAADSVLMDKQTFARNAANPYRMSAWDGKSGQLQTQDEINQQTIANSMHYQLARAADVANPAMLLSVLAWGRMI